MIDAEEYLRVKGRRTEQALDAYLARRAGAPTRLIEAMRYSLLAPAKRLRPALVLGAAELFGDDSVAMPAACAVEMIHTYSLIHDDLPCMDDDDLRRGQPSCHKVYGEAMAILAGDTLLTLAFDVLCETGSIDVTREFARASGPHGMAGGQVLDLEAEGRSIRLGELRTVHAMKTGALIRSAVRAGAMLGGADPEQLDMLSRYGELLGLAFQITDDVLDAAGEASSMGKTIGKDAERGKSTFPGLVGATESGRMAQEAVEAAKAALADTGLPVAALLILADYSVARTR